MTIPIPDFALVLLIGPSGCGKSTFARKHFRPTEVLSSDYFRGLLCDDPMNQAASRDAFWLLHTICAKRLEGRRRTVIDATNVRTESRRPLLEMARWHGAPVVAVVFDFSAEFCHARNQQRLAERPFGPEVTRGHADALQYSLGLLAEEGYAGVYVLRSEEDVNAVVIERVS